MLTQPCTVSFGEQRCPALYFRVTLGSLVPWYFVSSSQQNKIKEAKRKSNTSIFEFLFLRETWVLKEMKRRKKLCKWTGGFCSSFFFFLVRKAKHFNELLMGSKWTLMLSLPCGKIYQTFLILSQTVRKSLMASSAWYNYTVTKGIKFSYSV